MNNARDRILDRLRKHQNIAVPQIAVQKKKTKPIKQDELIAQFTRHQQAVHGEVCRMPRDEWLNWLANELPQRGLENVLVGTSDLGQIINDAGIDKINVRQYEQPVETFKAALFQEIEVAITDCRGAIAETGSLIVWPDQNQPRLMSLVPPVHIVLLDARQIYSTFKEAMKQQEWHLAMPSNALLISGPSKTADIEQTLAYGIHGPKQLVTLILEDT